MAEHGDQTTFIEPELDGRVGLVTGASRGIGMATLLELGAAGMNIIGTSTSDQGAAAIDQMLRERDLKGFGVVLRLEEAGDLDAWMRSLEERAEGDITVLVNNAGVTDDGLLVTKKKEQWDNTLEVNLSGPVFLTKAVIGSRRKGGMLKAGYGSIVNMSSVVPHLITGGQSGYAATKAAMEAVTRQLAGEYANRSIRVNAVAAGGIDTDMTRRLDPSRIQVFIDHTPLGRLGTPEEIARAVRFLVSPAASFITGQTLGVNGGMLG